VKRGLNFPRVDPTTLSKQDSSEKQSNESPRSLVKLPPYANCLEGEEEEKNYSPSVMSPEINSNGGSPTDFRLIRSKTNEIGADA